MSIRVSACFTNWVFSKCSVFSFADSIGIPFSSVSIIGTCFNLKYPSNCSMIRFRSIFSARRGDILFQNYLGRKIRIAQPSQCIQCRLPNPFVPQILVPSIHVGDTNEIVRFKFEETSNYVKMWKDYPKRKPRVPTKEDEQVK